MNDKVIVHLKKKKTWRPFYIASTPLKVYQKIYAISW